MRKFSIILISITLTNVAFGQENRTLRQQMWDYIKPCYSAIQDGVRIEHGDEPFIVEDTINGYLEVSGSWPTCGCSCSSTVGAYKKLNGEYLFLGTEEWSCAYSYKVISNSDIAKIMPIGFGLESFIDTMGYEKSNRYSSFYLKIDIPRKGTKTKFTIEIIPLGLLETCKGNLCYSIKTPRGETEFKHLFYLKEVVSKITSLNSLMLLMNGNTEKLTDDERKVINEKIDGKTFTEKINFLSQNLLFLYSHYKVFERLKYKSLIMDWDKNISRFKIIDTENAPPKIDFMQFILKTEISSMTC